MYIQYTIASGVTDEGQRGDLPRGKLNVKNGLTRNLYFTFSILLFFSRLLFLCFSDYFLGLKLYAHGMRPLRFSGACV